VVLPLPGRPVIQATRPLSRHLALMVPPACPGPGGFYRAGA